MTPTTVIYHANCMDGTAAALVVRKALREQNMSSEALFFSAQYGDDPIDEKWVKGRHVIIVDFSYPRETLQEIKEVAHSLLVLDHHASACEALADLPYCIFNLDKSGAMLAWEYFFPGEPAPKLVEYVQDRDLWFWLLPFSREISAALRSYPWVPLNRMERFFDDENITPLVSEGAAILRYQRQIIEKALKVDPIDAKIGGHFVACLNVSCFGELASEIGHALLDQWPGLPFVATFFDTVETRVFQLRSRRGGFDVAKVAKRYGGGGHPTAAGFSIPLAHDALHLEDNA